MIKKKPDDNTPERLLDCAERLFARKGFDAVSIREITTCAKSNLAAVNYHFGNKTNLYMEVFRQRWVPRTRKIRKRFNEMLESDTPELKNIVNAVATAFLDGPLSDNDRMNHVQLMQRELANPTQALDMVVAEVMEPYQQELSLLIRPHLPAAVDEQRLRLSLLSIIAMTLYFTFTRPAVTRLTGQEYDETFKSVLIDHITAFALNGINGLKEEYGADSI